MTNQERLERYQKINASFTDTFVFHLGVNAGFFSEFNNMILAMIYCYKSKIRFLLYSDDANFKVTKGWEDFFLPFCTQVHDENHSTLNWRWVNEERQPLLPQANEFKNKIGITYLTHDLWKHFNNYTFKYHFFNFSELEIKGFTRDVAKYFIEMIWNYNLETQQKINSYFNSIKLPEKYTGFHIRGGDKFIEHSLIDYKKYIDKANKIECTKNAFILTDDYRIFKQLIENYPDWTFTTLCTPEENGYFHEEYMKLSKEQKAEKLIKLFASIDILSKSSHFFGTYTSNPGMYLAMKMPKNSVTGMDSKFWRIRW